MQSNTTITSPNSNSLSNSNGNIIKHTNFKNQFVNKTFPISIKIINDEDLLNEKDEAMESLNYLDELTLTDYSDKLNEELLSEAFDSSRDSIE